MALVPVPSKELTPNTEHALEQASSRTAGSDAAAQDTDAKGDLEGSEMDRVARGGVLNEYPEGGARAYLTVAGASLCLCTCFGLTNSWGVFQSELKKNQLSEYPPSTISWIGSTSLLLLYLGGLPAGRLFDAGFCRYEVVGGSILYLLGIYTLSVSSQYWSIFLSYAILTGVGIGAVFTPAVSAIGTYFQRKRARMLGIAVASSALGSVFFPIMMNRLFQTIGFGPAIRAVAYLQTGCYIIVNILIVPRKLPPKVQPPLAATLVRFTRQPLTWVLSVGCALVMMGCWVPLFFIQVYLEGHDSGGVLTTYCLAIANGAAAVGRLASGPIADRFGVLNTAVPVAFATGTLSFSLIAVKSFGAAITWLVLFGIANGLFVTILTPILMTLAVDVSEIGTRVGFGLVLVAVASFVGSPIAGALLTSSGGYLAPFCFSGAALVAGGCLLAFARTVQSRVKKTWRV